MGRQIAVRGGHAGRPVPAPPACLPAGGTSVCAPGCAQHVWTDIRVCQWMGTEQERVLVCMRACPRSGLQESADVQAPHTCVMGACALSAWGWPSRNCLRVRRERSVALTVAVLLFFEQARIFHPRAFVSAVPSTQSVCYLCSDVTPQRAKLSLHTFLLEL